ncbi:MAG: cation transporter [Bacteroidales bacterium]|nr:cation transporter [Bacteroidales bacterium]
MKERKTFYWSNIEGWGSIIINIILFFIKYWAGILTGSIAIIADAWHSLSDSISSIIVLTGTKISRKPADKKHPFGYGRAELIASVIIGVFLSVIAFEFVLKGIGRLEQHQEVVYNLTAIIIITISILIKELLAEFAFWTSKKTKLQVLRADAWHHRTDAISSAVILSGILLGKHLWWIDGVLSILVAILIFYAAYEILKDGISPLIGEEPDEKLISRIYSISNDVAGFDTHIHHLHIHKYGSHIELTFHIKLPKDMIFEEVHNISSNIENKIKKDLDIDATIHMEPLLNDKG